MQSWLATDCNRAEDAEVTILCGWLALKQLHSGSFGITTVSLGGFTLRARGCA